MLGQAVINQDILQTFYYMHLSCYHPRYHALYNVMATLYNK